MPGITINADIIHNEAKNMVAKNFFNDCAFRAHFGVSTTVAAIAWNLIGRNDLTACQPEPRHLLWGLSFLKIYGSEEVHCTLARSSRNSFRKWCWIIVKQLALLNQVSGFYHPDSDHMYGDLL